MNWLNIKSRERISRILKRGCIAGCILFGAPKAATASVVSATAPTDTTVVIVIDSTTTVRIPETLFREQARRMGLLDSTQADSAMRHRYFEQQGYHLDADGRLSRYDRRRLRSRKRWNHLIPNQATLQFAGSIGVLSAGLGWHYGRGDHWETEFLVGFLPRFKSCEAHATFTLKERYVPWHCEVSRRWTIEPLTTGLFFNTISGDHFWKNLPDRYPKKYYGFPTKLRSNIFIGQRFRYKIPSRKRFYNQAISFYYELSTCDLYIVSKAVNKDFPWRDTFSLAFGLRWDM